MILILSLLALEARAEVPCALNEEVEAYLSESYGEEQVHTGVGRDGTLWIIYRSKDGKTWSLVRRYVERSCLESSGFNWVEAEDG